MKTIEELKQFLVTSLPNEKIYLFGSRARGDERIHSDIDIAVESERALSEKLAQIRYTIEESLLPYKVDIVDLSKAPYLKGVIDKEGIRWV